MPLLILFIVVLIGVIARYLSRPKVVINVISIPPVDPLRVIENAKTDEEMYCDGPMPTPESIAAGKEAIFQIFDQFPKGYCWQTMSEYHDEYYKSRAPIEDQLPSGVHIDKTET